MCVCGLWLSSLATESPLFAPWRVARCVCCCRPSLHCVGPSTALQVGFWEYGRRKEMDAAIAARQHAVRAMPADGWSAVGEASILEEFLQSLFVEVPFCLKLQAMLDWHVNPVTAVLVTQYVPRARQGGSLL